MKSNYPEQSISNPGTLWEIFDAYGDEVLIVDRNGELLFINEIACDRKKDFSKDIIGTHFTDLFLDTNIQNFQFIFNQVVETGQSIVFVKKEEDRWIKTLIYPIYQQEGCLTSIVICNRDITRQIEAEEKLKRTTIELVNTQENERYRISREGARANIGGNRRT